MRKRQITDSIIPASYRAGDDFPMDNKAVRKRNIEWLVGQHGGPTELGKLIERDQVQVSQWRGGKPIGDKLARHIETKLAKPKGWLDQPQWEPNDSAAAASVSQAGRLDGATITNAQHALLRFLRRRDPNATLDLEDPADAQLFAGALDIIRSNADPFDASARVMVLVEEYEAKKRGRGTDQQDGGAARGKARKAVPRE